MRNRLLLLTAAVVLSACADDQHATAPASRSSRSNSSAGDVMPLGQGIGVPDAKPIDQVGFTKTFVAFGAEALLTRGVTESGYSQANCPAGSVIVGGGYEIVSGNYYGVADLRITQNRPSPNAAPTSWAVTGKLTGNTDDHAAFYATAVCAQ
jgi:hypothetical protein